jgi:enamine deaminase RidA (YjgF/YER057c/UK114 family)|tara:strand:+ start:380 stop:850 length:471 start_codon:yes stop_codon:yes gene_type:complete
MSTVRERIQDLGFTLPTPPSPVATYVPSTVCGNLLLTSGQIPMIDGVLQYKGSVPHDQPIEAAIKAAELCGLNTLAVASAALGGSLERIIGVVQLRVYVASNQGFTDQSLIANGVSDMMVAIFGEAGKHVRVAIGSIGLPLGATVEVEASFKISPE